MNENTNTNLVKVIIKRPGEVASVESIVNDYETLKEIVGGFIEQCYTDVIKLNVAMIINEEGKLLNLQKNFNIKDYSDYVVGNAIFIRYENGEVIDLTDEDITDIINWINTQNAIRVNAFTKWLDLFLEEKEFDTSKFITLSNGVDYTISIQYANVIDYLKECDDEVQKAIKTALVKIDFFNGSISEFLKSIAKEIYFNN